jgi:hypothetical protein
MQRTVTGFLIAVIATLSLGTSVVLASNPVGDVDGVPSSIQVDTGSNPAVAINQGPGDDQPPPQIIISTPQGDIAPTL